VNQEKSEQDEVIRCLWFCRYMQGALRSKSSDDPALVESVEGAARWMNMTVNMCDHDADVIEDWELDELISWSTGLDFDDYWKDWHSIATSDLSEALVRKLVKLCQL